MTIARRLGKSKMLSPPKVTKRSKVINLEERMKNPVEWFIDTRTHLIDYTAGKLAEAEKKNNKEDIATYKHILDIYKAQLSKMREYREQYKSEK